MWQDDVYSTYRVYWTSASGARKAHRANWPHATDRDCCLELLTYAWSWHKAVTDEIPHFPGLTWFDVKD